VEHEPALTDSVIEYLLPALASGGVVVDATFGGGGHARRVLDISSRVEVVGIDRDPKSLATARAHLAPREHRLRIVRDDFQNLETVLERLGVASVRGVLFDLGVSSPQLDEPGRGFSYRADGPLDMRMDPSQALSAHEVVNTYQAVELERIIREYGEERFARRIARAIVEARPIATTTELADAVARAVSAGARHGRGHPARRTFQAVRIEVNRELEALRTALPAATRVLSPGGRMVAVSYHSLEDRIVKQHFAREARDCTCPPALPVCRCGASARLRVLTRRPVRPTRAEVERNPRSRSAKLRAAERMASAPAPEDGAR